MRRRDGRTGADRRTGADGRAPGRRGVRLAAAIAALWPLLPPLPLPAAFAQTPAAGFRRFESQNVRAAPRGDSVGVLLVPEAVQQRAATTARDDDALVQAVEHRIHCTCGCNLDVFTCRTTDFNCATSPAMHRVVLARLDSGMTADQVVAAFAAQYGPSILMQPPKRGFDWAAYVMPFVALGAGLLIVGRWMRRWVRAGPAGADAASAPGAPDASLDAAGAPQPSELERLARELQRFEA